MQVRTSCAGRFTARNEDGIFGFGRPCFPLGRLSLSCQLILVLEESLSVRSPTRIFVSAAARWYQAQRRRATRILLHDLLCLPSHPFLLDYRMNRLQPPNGLSPWMRRCQPIPFTTPRLKEIRLLHHHRMERHLLHRLPVHYRHSQSGRLHTIFSKRVSRKRGNLRTCITIITSALNHLTHPTRLSCIAQSHPSRVSPVHLRTTFISSQKRPRTQVCLSSFSLIARLC